MGTTLPAGLSAGMMISWQRPSEFLAEQCADGAASPCVVQMPPPPEDPEAAATPLERVPLPNKLVVAEVAAEALPSLQWLASCFQLVAMQAARLDEGAPLLSALLEPMVLQKIRPLGTDLRTGVVYSTTTYVL